MRSFLDPNSNKNGSTFPISKAIFPVDISRIHRGHMIYKNRIISLAKSMDGVARKPEKTPNRYQANQSNQRSNERLERLRNQLKRKNDKLKEKKKNRRKLLEQLAKDEVDRQLKLKTNKAIKQGRKIRQDRYKESMKTRKLRLKLKEDETQRQKLEASRTKEQVKISKSERKSNFIYKKNLEKQLKQEQIYQLKIKKLKQIDHETEKRMLEIDRKQQRAADSLQHIMRESKMKLDKKKKKNDERRVAVALHLETSRKEAIQRRHQLKQKLDIVRNKLDNKNEHNICTSNKLRKRNVVNRHYIEIKSKYTKALFGGKKKSGSFSEKNECASTPKKRDINHTIEAERRKSNNKKLLSEIRIIDDIYTSSLRDIEYQILTKSGMTPSLQKKLQIAENERNLSLHAIQDKLLGKNSSVTTSVKRRTIDRGHMHVRNRSLDTRNTMKRPCKLCGLSFTEENLPGNITMKAVIDLRKSWGLVTEDDAARWPLFTLPNFSRTPAKYYDAAQVCVFCNQFFYTEFR